MGQKSKTETFFALVNAFVQQTTWKQADLARELGVSTETVRAKMVELQAAGFKVHQDKEHPHVFWSVSKNWFPGALMFTEAEAHDLVRLVSRAKAGVLRDKVLAIVEKRLRTVDKLPVPTPAREDTDEVILATIEDAMARNVSLKMRYFAASRGDESERFASVHRIEHEPRLQFIATCHRSGKLKRFRVSNVLSARLAQGETFREAEAADIDVFVDESLGGFRADGPRVRCAFVVEGPDAAWVARNLPDRRMEREGIQGGARFTVETSAVQLIARFVVGLGASARAETPELAAAVRALAEGALKPAR